MAKEPRCWASFLDDCGGGISGEHVVSECLLSKSVHVKGLHWCVENYKSVGVKSLVVNCLCRNHNAQLSPLDEAAKKWDSAIEWMALRRFGPGDGPFRREEVSGLLLTKWMAKTACNIAASGKRHIPKLLAEYAFSEEDNPAVFVYFYTAAGLRVEIDGSHIGSYWIHDVSDPDRVLVCFSFRGLPFVIGTMPIDGAEELVEKQFGISRPQSQGLVTRVREIVVDAALQGVQVRRGSIVVSWDRLRSVQRKQQI